jgi:predicted AlkP superfamily phosphohydrolase/phosphomutase
VLYSSLFNQFVDLDLSAVNDSLKSNSNGYLTFIVPALVGLAIMVLLAPVMYILVCCPMACCLR